MKAQCWKDATQAQRETFYSKILARFDIDLSQPHVLVAVNDLLKTTFKELRHKFHKHYLGIQEGLNIRDHPHELVKHEDWEVMCTWFESEKFQKMSARNKESRKKLKVNHLGGCKAFVRHRHEQKDPVTNKEMTRVYFYRRMLWNEQKGWIAPEALENYDKMLDMRSQPVEEGSTALTDWEIADRVLGTRSGYVRGLGRGEVAPRKSRAINNQSEEMNRLRMRAVEDESQLEELCTWKVAQQEISNAQQQMINSQQEEIDAQKRKQAENEQFLNYLKSKFGTGN